MVAINAISPLFDPSFSKGITLVSQGGGIGGGAYVVGVMKALKQIGVLEYITKTYTSSAATPAVVYTMLEKDRLMEYIWINEITRKEVIHLWRFFENRPILNIDYVVHEILPKHPINEEVFRSSQISYNMSVAQLNSAEQRLDHLYLRNTDSYSFLKMMHGSLAIPLLYGKSVKLEDGTEVIDGGVLRQIPFLDTSLEKNSLEQMIVIGTSEKNKRRFASYEEKVLLAAYPPLDVIDEKIHTAIKNRHDLSEREYKLLERKQEQGQRILIIQPSQPLCANIICNKANLVEATIKQGYDDAYGHHKVLEAMCLRKIY